MLYSAPVRDLLIELATAFKGRADVIVTFNVKDFPSDALEAYDRDAQQPVFSYGT